MSNRKIDNLREPSNLQLKVQTGYPTAIDAKEGTVTLRYVPGTGLALFAYYANRWSMMKLSNMNAKDESIVENLKVKNLQIDKSAKFNGSSVDISEKNIPSIRKWDKSYNDIRSGEIESNFKKATLEEDLQIGTDGTGIILKNNTNALNIRNQADDADVQLAVGYGGTGLTAITTLLNSNTTTSDLSDFATASDGRIDTKLANFVGSSNIETVGTIETGEWQGDAIAVNYTAAKVTSVTAAGTGFAHDTTTGAITLTVTPNTIAGAISANTLAWSQMADLTASKVPVINSGGEMTASAVTATELGHLDGVTSAIQTQLASKASLAGASFTGKIATNSPIGFSHHALTDVSSNQSTYDFDFGTNGNKIRLAFTGGDVTIAEAQLIFPTNISGNYTVLIKNHTSAITKNEITAWYSHFGTAGTDKTIVKWPNGDTPSVTESATGRMDIFSFYWDCDDKVAYGVSTLNFAV